MSRPLLQISVTTMLEAEEAVAALLEQVFHQTPSLYTDEETLVTRVSVFLAPARLWTEARRRRILRGLERIRAAGLPLGPARIQVRRLSPDGWAHSWKRHFRPLDIGGRLLIKPSWNRRAPRPGQSVITLDPGLSFGTGQHPTTRFCLEQVVAARGDGPAPAMLDVGTGSGILAMAAARMGYAPIVAFDYDPVAVRVARANVAANGLTRSLRLLRGDVHRPPEVTRGKFDLVCANLLAELLIEEARRVARWVRPSGRLVLAGILDRQFAEVRGAYERLGLRLLTDGLSGEWRSGAFVWAGRLDKCNE